jgi:2-methylcitrate dehydratase PrpD
MVKPLHAGLAARNGILAAMLAKAGMDASERAIDGPQGYLAAFASERASLSDIAADLGARWEIVDTGITVKLYPSCAGTHPAIDAVLDLRSRHQFAAADVNKVDVFVDAITPTVLIYDKPSSGLEGKFSMPFCLATAIADGAVTIASFDETRLGDPALRPLMERVSMHVDRELDPAAPRLTQARVSIALRDGRVLTQMANGARGYPDRPASAEELDAKFLACASRTLPESRALDALRMLRSIENVDDIRQLTANLAGAD